MVPDILAAGIGLPLPRWILPNRPASDNRILHYSITPLLHYSVTPPLRFGDEDKNENEVLDNARRGTMCSHEHCPPPRLGQTA